MGLTLTQKILAHHAGLDQVKAGQLINAKLDIVLGNDITKASTPSKPPNSYQWSRTVSWE